MGKSGRRQRKPRKPRNSPRGQEGESDDNYPYTDDEGCNSDVGLFSDLEDQELEGMMNKDSDEIHLKYLLYQQSVQSPKGDISYMMKFFLMYVGGRIPLHLQEDFCGTALLSTEWVRSDPRRTAMGIDLDLEALTWCSNNNLNRLEIDGFSRIHLFHGNVLHPNEAKLFKFDTKTENLINPSFQMTESIETGVKHDNVVFESFSSSNLCDNKSVGVGILPAKDIICAFNYSCCCLRRREDLLIYFKYALSALSKDGGIFVMDLYGGFSSESKLRLERRFRNFTYVWEQDELDVLSRTTKISLHFRLPPPQHTIRNAFSYHWRLWSLAEINECMKEAGFGRVHFWMREMPDTNNGRMVDVKDSKYEETLCYIQRDAWNAYVVAVSC